MLVTVPELRRVAPLAVGPVAALAAVKLALHLWVNATTPYGFHRDEFLYLAMGRRLQPWAMDFPPGIALLSEATRTLVGDSLAAIRLGPALAGALLVVAAALFAREFGGGRKAQTLAAVAVLASRSFSDRPTFSSRWCSTSWPGPRRCSRSPGSAGPPRRAGGSRSARRSVWDCWSSSASPWWGSVSSRGCS